MATLAERNSQIVVLKIDISEPDSPVARQYGIKTIPYFEIYDENGREVARGDEAVEWLEQAMQEVDLSPVK
ncbi:MAG: thioredoxin family protein [Vulcanimicrobiota bacterium]